MIIRVNDQAWFRAPCHKFDNPFGNTQIIMLIFAAGHDRAIHRVSSRPDVRAAATACSHRGRSRYWSDDAVVSNCRIVFAIARCINHDAVCLISLAQPVAHRVDIGRPEIGSRLCSRLLPNTYVPKRTRDRVTTPYGIAVAGAGHERGCLEVVLASLINRVISPPRSLVGNQLVASCQERTRPCGTSTSVARPSGSVSALSDFRCVQDAVTPTGRQAVNDLARGRAHIGDLPHTDCWPTGRSIARPKS